MRQGEDLPDHEPGGFTGLTEENELPEGCTLESTSRAIEQTGCLTLSGQPCGVDLGPQFSGERSRKRSPGVVATVPRGVAGSAMDPA